MPRRADATVLLVDDEVPFLLSLVDGLEPFAEEFRVVAAAGGAEALQVLVGQRVDLVVTDLRMPGVDGVALLEHLRRRHPLVPVVVVTALNVSELEEKLALCRPLAVLDKPIELEELVAAIRRGLPSSSGQAAPQHMLGSLLALLRGALGAVSGAVLRKGRPRRDRTEARQWPLVAGWWHASLSARPGRSIRWHRPEPRA